MTMLLLTSRFQTFVSTMMPELTQEGAQVVLAQNPLLRYNVRAACELSRLPRGLHGLAGCCAVHLACNSWPQKLGSNHNMLTEKTARRAVRASVKRACKELRTVGILPESALLWLIIRWLIIPYLYELLRHWVYAGRLAQENTENAIHE